MEGEYSLPVDWEKPDWEYFEKVHGWRNYTSSDIQKEWPSFNEYQKKILAINYQNEANKEHWD